MDSLCEQLNNHTALELTKMYIITSRPTNVKGRECGSTAEHIKIHQCHNPHYPQMFGMVSQIEPFPAAAEHVSPPSPPPLGCSRFSLKD